MAIDYFADLEGNLTPAGLAHVLAHRRATRHLDHSSPLPLIAAGLSPFLKLPHRMEPRTLTRARMAAEICRAVSANGNVTREDLDQAGFTCSEIADLFTEARRISQVERMAA